MNRKVNITILGEPVGKGRPKFTTVSGFAKAYTPAKTANYETYIKLAYSERYKQMAFNVDEPLKITIYAYQTIPGSESKRRKALMLADKIRPTKKPDWDNIGKIVGDALNKVAYPDDKQIVEAHIYKHFSDVPRLEIEIEVINNE